MSETLANEIRDHIGHQWSDRSYVQSEKVRDLMRRVADALDAKDARIAELEAALEQIDSSPDSAPDSAQPPVQLPARTGCCCRAGFPCNCAGQWPPGSC